MNSKPVVLPPLKKEKEKEKKNLGQESKSGGNLQCSGTNYTAGL